MVITVAFGKNKQTVKTLVAGLLKREKNLFSNSDDFLKTKFALFNTTGKQSHDIITAKEKKSNTDSSFFTLIDADSDFKFAENNKSILISYGLNPLSTAIPSSIQSTDSSIYFHFCLQRRIKPINGKILDPQEFPVSINKKNVSVNDALAFCIVALILGIPKEKISLS